MYKVRMSVSWVRDYFLLRMDAVFAASDRGDARRRASRGGAPDASSSYRSGLSGDAPIRAIPNVWIIRGGGEGKRKKRHEYHEQMKHSRRFNGQIQLYRGTGKDFSKRRTKDVRIKLKSPEYKEVRKGTWRWIPRQGRRCVRKRVGRSVRLRGMHDNVLK